MNAPVFILFKPQLGENIGAVARAMSNFGLSELRIVAPRDGWPNDAATAMAAHGVHILASATIHETLADACRDITQLYATSARERAMGKPVLTPKEWAQHSMNIYRNGKEARQVGRASHEPAEQRTMEKSEGFSGGIAILFGPERSGLANEELALADAIITVPVSEANPSLNLAQSSVVMAYEWFAAQSGGGDKQGEASRPSEPSAHEVPPHVRAVGEREGIAQCATKQELESFFEHLKPLLEQVNYFREENKVEQMWLTLRSIFNRMQPSSQELRTLRGVIRSLQRENKRQK